MRLRLPKQLPQLSGWVLALYRYGFPVLFVLALCSTLYLTPSRMTHDNHANRILMASGLKTAGFEASGQKVAPFSPEARAAGIGKGDLLVAIDGQPAPPDLDGVVARLDGPDRALVRITVRSAGGPERMVTLHRDKNYLDAVHARVGLTYEGRRVAQLVINTIGALLGLLVAALLYLRRKRDPVAALIAFAATIDSVNVKAMTTGVMSLGAQDILLRFPAAAVALLFGIGISLFPSGRFSPRLTWAPIAMFCVFTSLVQLAWNDVRWSIPLNVLGLITMVVLAVVIVQRYRREPDGIIRQQMKFAMLGIALMALFFSLSTIIQIRGNSVSDEGVAAWYDLVGGAIWSFGWICLQLGLLVSLLRFRLYDAETAISRSAVVGALTLFLGFIFAGSEKMLEVFGEAYFGEQGRGTAAVLSAVLAATLIAPLHHRISGWAERRFQKALVALRQRLPMLVGDLRETATPERLADIALDRIESGVRATHGAVVLGTRLITVRDVPRADAAGWLKDNPFGSAEQNFIRDDDDDLFPVRVALDADGCGRVGWLLLGPRPDGTLFGKDEREVLTDIAEPIARALAISAARQQESGRLRTLLTALETRLASLEVKLAKPHE